MDEPDQTFVQEDDSAHMRTTLLCLQWRVDMKDWLRVLAPMCEGTWLSYFSVFSCASMEDTDVRELPDCATLFPSKRQAKKSSCVMLLCV
eukprot:6481916-Amphidinium_carterae.1